VTATLETIDGRPALRFERHLPHPVERVWRAVTEPGELERWFVVPVPWTPARGERFEAAGQAGRITELDPPHVIAWEWSVERYRFELRPAGDGCLLVFTHVLNPAFGSAARFAAGWEGYFARLDAHLGGGFLSEEDAHAGMAGVEDRYAAAFAPPALLEEGPALRFERRLPHPPERVWRALTEPGELERWFPSDEPMVVQERVQSRLLAGTWFGDPVRFELRPDGDGCVLVLVHAFAERDTAARTAAGWDRSLARLEALLGGEPMTEAASLEAWPEVHERYAATFGVDPALGRRAYAEHPLT
jgi:uncharacterized protein YndB with AHSA1/START domain